MSERSVKLTYDAIFALIDVQQIWRRTRPFHQLNDLEKEELSTLLQKVKSSVNKIEEEML